jgi:hypothetical protein
MGFMHGCKEGEDQILSHQDCFETGERTYLPARGRLPWFAFFMRSFLSLRRRLLAMNSPVSGKLRPGVYRRTTCQQKRAKCASIVTHFARMTS